MTTTQERMAHYSGDRRKALQICAHTLSEQRYSMRDSLTIADRILIDLINSGVVMFSWSDDDV